MSTNTLNVAVIGAGPAGLVTARELMRAGATVTVFESATEPGGVWVYTSDTDQDPLGQAREGAVYSSLYQSLRTNLPRDLMAFQDFTFDSAGGGADDWPRFPHHSQVLTYLRNFADTFNITPSIQLEHRVTDVGKADADSPWQIETTTPDGTVTHATFDAIAVCNGHYSKTRVPALDDSHQFSGTMSHSHNYRTPEAYAGKRVALWGTSASGFDIANEIAAVAEHVYWLGQAFDKLTQVSPNRSIGPSPKGFSKSGEMIVTATDHVRIDAFMYCTGYHYDYPFLRQLIDVDDNWVNPLFKDIVWPEDPSLGFIGLPFLVLPFPLFEIQAKWFAKHLLGAHSLPARTEMLGDIKLRTMSLEEAGIAKRHYHRLGEHQFAYYNDLAQGCAEPELPAWFEKTWQDLLKAREQDPVKFRDARFPVRGPTVCLD